MKRIIKLTAIAFIFSSLISCSKNDTPTPVDPNITFKATLTGAAEAPANPSSGTGTSTLVFNNNTKMFTVTTTYSGLSGTATASHIHKGAIGVAGPVIFPFTNVTVSPIVYTSAALDATQEADLKA